jgi:hypothetical protein
LIQFFFSNRQIFGGSGQGMKKNRNRLLILLALLTIGLTPMPRAGYAMNSLPEPPISGGTWTGGFSGEPDTPNSKTTTSPHSAINVAPDQGSSGVVVVTRAMWWSWAIRIWAATHFGVGQ